MTAQLKRCTKCGEEKPATAEFFTRNNQSRDGWEWTCKVCSHERQRQARHRNPELYRSLNRAGYYRDHERNKARMLANKAKRGLASQMLYEEFRSRGCSVCTCQDSRVIQAHHRDPEAKDSNIRGHSGEFIPPAKMIAELAKCVPLCSNHHDLVHAVIRNGCASWPLEDILAKLRREHRAWVLEQAEAMR